MIMIINIKMIMEESIQIFILKYAHKNTYVGKKQLALTFLNIFHDKISPLQLYDLFRKIKSNVFDSNYNFNPIFDIFFDLTNDIRYLECQCDNPYNLEKFINQKLIERSRINNDLSIIENKLENLCLDKYNLSDVINTMIL